MTTKNASNGWRWVGLIVLLLILLLLWMTGHGPSASCCATPAAEPAAVPAPVAVSQPVVSFAVKTENGKVTLTGEVPSESERQAAVSAAIEVFGEGNVIDQLTIKQDASLPGWWDGLGGVMAWSKTGNGFGLSQLDNTITLTGVVPAETDKAAREGDVRAVVGPHLAIDNQMVVEAPAAPMAAAPDVPPCGSEMQVLVQFATGSATLSAAGKAQLNEVAKCISKLTEVGGHTDNVGGDALNLALSKARAEAVVSYLSAIDPGKGVLLSAVGYGATRPVADNATEEGRAQNRRIEFVAK